MGMSTHHAAILPFYHKFVLEHDHVLFTGPVFHQFLKTCAKCVEQVDGVSFGYHLLLVGKKADPLESRKDASRLVWSREIHELSNSLNQGAADSAKIQFVAREKSGEHEPF